MIQHFVYHGPDGAEKTMQDVVVTEIADDGKYSVAAKDRINGFQGISPGFGYLFDEAGNPVEPALPQEAAAISADMLAALQILLGGGTDG